MDNILKTIVQRYGWIHLSLGLFGNANFLIGSILFLPKFKEYKELAVWLFIVAPFLC